MFLRRVKKHQGRYSIRPDALIVVKRKNCFLESCLDSFRGLFIARLVQQSEHVLLVGFHARLVEGIHTQDVAADAASLFEEVKQTADAFLVEGRDGEAQVGHATVHVGQLGTKLSHLVTSSTRLPAR